MYGDRDGERIGSLAFCSFGDESKDQIIPGPPEGRVKGEQGEGEMFGLRSGKRGTAARSRTCQPVAFVSCERYPLSLSLSLSLGDSDLPVKRISKYISRYKITTVRACA